MTDINKCCKIRDECPLKIHNRRERWGVKNAMDFTSLDCKCDDSFRRCLKKVIELNFTATIAMVSIS